MLFNKIISLSLLAFQATLGVASPTPLGEKLADAIENREAAKIEDPTTHLLPRADHQTESGVITGTAADSLSTYGLATCVGLAASGTAGHNGVDKVLAHCRCVPPTGETFHQQVDQWVNAITHSGMVVRKVVVSIVDPNLVDARARQAQLGLNNYARQAAGHVTAPNHIVTVHRRSLSEPRPGGTLEVKQNGDIWAEGTKIH